MNYGQVAGVDGELSFSQISPQSGDVIPPARFHTLIRDKCIKAKVINFDGIRSKVADLAVTISNYTYP